MDKLKSQHAPAPEVEVTETERVTREEWLERAIDNFRPWFQEYAELTIPDKVQVSVGIPKGGASVIGQCFYDAEDGRPIIYVSPVLTDEARVLDVLVHELVHACLGPGFGHGKEFRDGATGIGLTGRMTSTTADPLLRFACQALARELGTYDHAGHRSMRRRGPIGKGKGDTPKGGIIPGADVPKKQTGSRYKKLVAEDCDECDYLIRTTRKWIEVGLPYCPHGVRMTYVEG